jgi:hypothetical protein
MNLSTLLLGDDDDIPSLTESERYEDSIDIQQVSKDDKGPGMGSMLAPVAVVGGIQAMRAVYNRLRGSEDDYDDDMPGVQEIILQTQQTPFGQGQGAQEAGQWAQMNQGLAQGAAQETVRGGAPSNLFANSVAYVYRNVHCNHCISST